MSYEQGNSLLVTIDMHNKLQFSEIPKGVRHHVDIAKFVKMATSIEESEDWAIVTVVDIGNQREPNEVIRVMARKGDK